jgi:hypothetical protein
MPALGGLWFFGMGAMLFGRERGLDSVALLLSGGLAIAFALGLFRFVATHPVRGAGDASDPANALAPSTPSESAEGEKDHPGPMGAQ